MVKGDEGCLMRKLCKMRHEFTEGKQNCIKAFTHKYENRLALRPLKPAAC